MNFASPISVAGLEDIASLELLVNSAYRGETSQKGWTTEADLLDGIRINQSSLTKIIQNPQSVILKYTDTEGNIRGCVYLDKKENALYLGMLTVSPELQGKGIGKELMKAAEDFAKSVGLRTITMTVISVRHSLIGWYERHGYFPTGETHPFPDDPDFGIPKKPLYFRVLEKQLD